MSAVSVTYILTASEDFRMNIRLACAFGAAVAAGLFILYWILLKRSERSAPQKNHISS